MKKYPSTLFALVIVLPIGGCGESDQFKPKTDTPVVINRAAVETYKLSPHIIREPKTVNQGNTVSYVDGSYMMDFERDKTFDLELLAIQPSNDLTGGVALRIISVPGKSTYAFLTPLNEMDTINQNIDWTRITTDITYLIVPTNNNNQWSDYKFLAVREYDQNENTNRFYWIRMKVNEAKTGFEIESYYR